MALKKIIRKATTGLCMRMRKCFKDLSISHFKIPRFDFKLNLSMARRKMWNPCYLRMIKDHAFAVVIRGPHREG